MKTKKQLKKEQIAIRKQLLVIEEKERKEKFNPYLEGFAGQCFIYRNNSYGGSDPKEKWDVFKRVVDVVKDSDGYINFIVEEFEIDFSGNLTFKLGYYFPYPDGREPFDHYEKITLEEYQNARVDMQNEIAAQKKLRKYIKEKS